MRNLETRLSRLEGNQPHAEAGWLVALDLPPDLRTRITLSQEAGTFPQSLADADLEAILAASDEVRRRT